LLVMALVNAFVPVLYAFSLLALVISTFAVIATDMFSSLVGIEMRWAWNIFLHRLITCAIATDTFEWQRF
jgi:hypothetical protein